MNKKIQDYILSGVNFLSEKKNARKQVFAMFAFLVLTNLYPCLSLKGIWTYLLIISAVLCLVNGLAIILLTGRKESTCNRLVIQTLIFWEWILLFSITGIIYYWIYYKQVIWIVLFLSCVVLIPVIIGVINAIRLRKEYDFSHKKLIRDGFIISGFSIGLVGVNFARTYLNDVNSKVAVCIAFIALFFLNSIMSIGLINIQRIYYLLRFGKDKEAIKNI